MEEGRVRGVRIGSGDNEEIIRADLVIGADGRNSVVAREAGAESYLEHEMPRNGYFTYIEKPRIWDEDPRYRDLQCFYEYQGTALHYIFDGDGDRLLLLSSPPREESRAWASNPRAMFLQDLHRCELMRPLIEAAVHIDKVIGFRNGTNYCRQAAGTVPTLWWTP